MKYYKILNEEECHHDLQYRDGWNEDPLPWNPSGSCEPGGIYFAPVKTILAFIDVGPWIREVKPDGEVYKDPSEPEKYKCHKVWLGKRRKITLEVMKELVEEGADVHANNDHALQWAARNGHLDVVKFLVEKGADVHADNDLALQWAASNGHLGVVKFLVGQGADVHAGDDHALQLAASNGHLDVVKFLKTLKG